MDKYDEAALLLELNIGNATISKKGGEFVHNIIAQALKEAAAEAYEDSADLSWEECQAKAAALRKP